MISDGLLEATGEGLRRTAEEGFGAATEVLGATGDVLVNLVGDDVLMNLLMEDSKVTLGMCRTFLDGRTIGIIGLGCILLNGFTFIVYKSVKIFIKNKIKKILKSGPL